MKSVRRSPAHLTGGAGDRLSPFVMVQFTAAKVSSTQLSM
jgi:hypothetical protein